MTADEGFDPDVCEDCGGRYILNSHFCFGAPKAAEGDDEQRELRTW